MSSFVRVLGRLEPLFVLILACLVVRPLFRLEYLNHWWSIESTFIADGRMLAEHLPHRHWQPNWYCGTRADYVYPPALRYGTAYLSEWLDISAAHAYHIYIGALYAVGLLAVYRLIRTGTRSRAWAWIGMAATALLSPSFAIMPEIRHDSGWGSPQRLHALMWYGEGPHISALSVLPFVFIASALAFRSGGYRWIGVAALASAAVVTHNFYGATALALLFPVVVWAHFLVRRDLRVFLKSVAIAAHAYGLTAWWLVPSYFYITARNLRYVAEPGDPRSIAIIALLVMGTLAATYFLARKRTQPASNEQAYTWFVFGGTVVMILYVLGRRWFHIQIAGETTRLIPELDLFLILAAIEGLRRLWMRKNVVSRLAVALALIASFSASARYIENFHQEYPRDRNWRDRVEYKVATWLQKNHPDNRVLVSGTNRFWMNVWYTIPQADGGSQQGLQNEKIATAQWRIFAGDNPDLLRLWLTALAVDVAVIPEEQSKELYHDVKHTKVWRATFPVLHDDGEGNIFYWIPRRSQGIARIVDTQRMRGLPEIPSEYETEQMRAYVKAIEAEPIGGGASDRVSIHPRPHPDHVRIEAVLAPGESILFQETFDPYWRAYHKGKPLRIERDPMNLMLIHARPGAHDIDLRFETPLEVRVGRWVSLLSTVVVLILSLPFRRRASANHPR